MSEDRMPVNISEEELRAVLDVPVRAHVRVSGMGGIHPKVVAKDLEAVKRCKTIEAVVHTMEEVKNRWQTLGIFRDVQYNLEPTQDGADNDICVAISVVKCMPKKSLGVFTTDTSLPEVTVALENVFGGRYSFKGNYIPPASRVHALSFSLLSNVPYIGQRAEYYLGRRTETKAFSLASGEKVEEIKATTRNQKSGLASELTVGFQRRAMLTKDRGEIPVDLLPDFSLTNKGYVRHELSVSSGAYHANPDLYNMYPLPISGRDLSLANEFAGGPAGGDFCFLKTEAQMTKYWPLGPFLSMQLSAKLAGIYPFGGSRIPLNDRLFLSTCHVRGFKSIGPSTLDLGRETGRFAATGGNALWASSMSLNFPFLFFPNNGVASMHLFANAGNLQTIDTREALCDWYKWLRTSACSVGAGIVITRIPLFGIAPSGRFELNISVPLGIDKNGHITTGSGSPKLFDRVRFGLVWSSNYTI